MTRDILLVTVCNMMHVSSYVASSASPFCLPAITIATDDDDDDDDAKVNFSNLVNG